MLAFLGGAISIISTPIAVTCAWVMRKRLNTVLGVIAKVVALIGFFGLIAFILTYANPFFKGS